PGRGVALAASLSRPRRQPIDCVNPLLDISWCQRRRDRPGRNPQWPTATTPTRSAAGETRSDVGSSVSATRSWVPPSSPRRTRRRRAAGETRSEVGPGAWATRAWVAPSSPRRTRSGDGWPWDRIGPRRDAFHGSPVAECAADAVGVTQQGLYNILTHSTKV